MKSKLLLSLLFPLAAVFGFLWQLEGFLPSTVYGVKPAGSLWPGMITMSFLHGDLKHLASNFAPMLILTFISFSVFKRFTWLPLLLGTPCVGFLTWIIGTSGVHIGMSGLVYMMAAFVVTMSIRGKDYRFSGIVLLVTFLYGGLVWGVLPTQENISWEGHLAGSIVGVVFGVFLRPTVSPAPKFRYEIEEELGISTDLETILKQQSEERRIAEETNNSAKIQEGGLSIASKEPLRIVYHFTSKKTEDTKLPPKTSDHDSTSS